MERRVAVDVRGRDRGRRMKGEEGRPVKYNEVSFISNEGGMGKCH